jgi:hypothetical protein
MKGISIAIETVVYMILAVTVLSVALFFFLSQAGPSQDLYTLESKRDRYCMAYVSMDYGCAGKNGKVVDGTSPEVLKNIGSACLEMTRKFSYSYDACGESATLQCIQQCCITCPQRK